LYILHYIFSGLAKKDRQKVLFVSIG